MGCSVQRKFQRMWQRLFELCLERGSRLLFDPRHVSLQHLADGCQLLQSLSVYILMAQTQLFIILTQNSACIHEGKSNKLATNLQFSISVKLLQLKTFVDCKMYSNKFSCIRCCSKQSVFLFQCCANITETFHKFFNVPKTKRFQ